MQYGYNKENNTRPQVKLMAASVDIETNGHLVAVEVVSGQHADDPLYQPLLARMRQILQQPGLLYLGDSKMSAIASRADIVAAGDFYFVPLAEGLVGLTKAFRVGVKPTKRSGGSASIAGPVRGAHRCWEANRNSYLLR
jgi:hypothetical protein